MRLRIDLAYDGTDFSGWAAQPGLRTVQGELELWISRALRLSEPISLTVAGRTDAGVHAVGQVAHVDLPSEVGLDPHSTPDDLFRRLQRVLPADLTVWSVRRGLPGFDARHSAIWRRYCYRLADRPLNPLRRREVAAVRSPLDLNRLNDAARTLLGLRDFAAFCKRREGASTIRTLLDLHAVRCDTGVVELTVRADAFCHSMVRSLTGALVAVGTGRRDGDWLQDMASAIQRPSQIQVMPAHGLSLEEVGYPAPEQLADRAVQARARRDSSELSGEPSRGRSQGHP